MPPMPKPEDFGITEADWSNCHTLRRGEVDEHYKRSARAKVAAYNTALETWKEIAKSCAERPDQSSTLDITSR